MNTSPFTGFLTAIALVLLMVWKTGNAQVSPPSVSSSSKYPHLTRLFVHMDTRAPLPAPQGLRAFLKDSVAIRLSEQDMVDFLDAGVKDGVTLLRATALYSKWVRSRDVPVFTEGETIQKAVRGFTLGLSFPVKHVAYFFYVPNDSVGGDFQAHLRVIYTRQYAYPFDKDIFNANVLIQGQEIRYNDGKNRRGYLVTTDVHYSDQVVEYTNVQGIAGQKRGALGFFQKVLFFVPKTLYGLKLSDGNLLIDAFVNQRIDQFEQELRFLISRS